MLNYIVSKVLMKIGPKKGKTMYFAKADKPRIITFEEVIKDIAEMSSLTTGEKEEDVTAATIKTPKIRFYLNAYLHESMKSLRFSVNNPKAKQHKGGGTTPTPKP